MTTTGSGVTVENQNVPTIGGADYRRSIGMSSEGAQAQTVASAHLTDGNRAEGVNYPETPGIAVTTRAYPAGTSMSDSTPGDPVN